MWNNRWTWHLCGNHIAVRRREVSETTWHEPVLWRENLGDVWNLWLHFIEFFCVLFCFLPLPDWKTWRFIWINTQTGVRATLKKGHRLSVGSVRKWRSAKRNSKKRNWLGDAMPSQLSSTITSRHLHLSFREVVHSFCQSSCFSAQLTWQLYYFSPHCCILKCLNWKMCARGKLILFQYIIFPPEPTLMHFQNKSKLATLNMVTMIILNKSVNRLC